MRLLPVTHILLPLKMVALAYPSFFTLLLCSTWKVLVINNALNHPQLACLATQNLLPLKMADLVTRATPTHVAM